MWDGFVFLILAIALVIVSSIWLMVLLRLEKEVRKLLGDYRQSCSFSGAPANSVSGIHASFVDIWIEVDVDGVGGFPCSDCSRT